jgi:hypothetical protein
MTAARGRRGLVAVTAVMLLAACSGSPSDDGPPSPGPEGAATNAVAADDAVTDSSQGAGLLLSEVGFGGFVEIVNAGLDPVSTSGLTLEVDGRPVDLEPDGDTLDPGGLVLVETELDAVSGSAVLVNGAGQLLDRVAWGLDQSRAVSMAVGDFVADRVEPGTTIGRPPGSAGAGDPTGWVPYAPADATPGAANPVPGVAVLLPIDGAILTGATADLDWYPAPGAESYTVEIATDEDFVDPVLTESVAEPLLTTDALDPGSYFWRIEPVGADGEGGGFSEPSAFELQAPAGRAGVRATTGRQITVPWLAQRKDTTMLLLEEPHEHQPMAWDAPHQPPRREDPADQMNCALAMVAMVNRFYGGDLSQDRIGYELFNSRRPGPEEDLNYGYGLNIQQTLAAFAFALGAPVELIPEFESYDDAWAIITREVDAGRPVAGAGPRHGFVIKGYRELSDGHRVITVNDPARGTVDIDLDARGTDPSNLGLFVMPAEVTARDQEVAVTRDGDGDGVVDFDELERFHTDAGDPDSDDDEVRDKQDIVSGVFDPQYGYALHPADPAGRDYDGDELATELDPDSDNGECEDGAEDTNGDGHRTGAETWSFDITDDSCFALNGTVEYARKGVFDTGPDSPSRQSGKQDAKLTIKVQLQVDPSDPTALVDAGSTFTVDSKTDVQREVGGDCSPTRILSTSNGTYRFDDPPVPSPGHTREEIGDDHSYIGGILDPENKLVILTIVPYYPETHEETCGLVDIPGLPIVVDFLACDSGTVYGGLGVIGRIEDAESGPAPVDVTCKNEGPSMLWDNEKVTVSGNLKLTSARG